MPNPRKVAFNIKGNDYGLARVRMVAIVPIFIPRGARTVTIERDDGSFRRIRRCG
jgi:hypothetical protein